MSRSSSTAFCVRFALVVALLLTWAFGIGRYGGPDEPAHVLRSYAAAHGDVLGDSAAPLPAGYRFVDVPSSLAGPDPTCYRHDPELTSRCAAAEGDAQGTRRVGTSAGTTPPLYHLLVGSVVRLIGNPADTAWYRFVAALLHALVVALALTRLRHSAAAVVLSVAVLTPGTWFLFGVVNPNSLEIALAMLAWAGVARMLAARSGKGFSITSEDIRWVAVPIAVAIAVRPIAIVVLVAAMSIIEVRCRPGRRRWLLMVPSAAAVASLMLWNLWIDVQVDDERTAVHHSFLHNLGDAVGALPHTAVEAAGSLGWNEFDAPVVAMVAWAVVVGAIAVVALRQIAHEWRRPVWVAGAAWLTVLVLTPVVFDVALAARVGPIWQGRYSLPVLIGLPVLLVSGARPTWATRDGRSLSSVAAAVVVLACIQVISYWATVRRYAVGTNGSWWLSDAYASTTWLGPRTWVSVHLVIVFIATVVLMRTRPDDHTM